MPKARSSVARVYRPFSSGYYATSFDLTENPLIEAGAWLNGGMVQGGTNNTLTDMQSGNGVAYGTQPPGGSYDDSAALCIATTFSIDQRVSGVINLPNGAVGSGSHEILILLRGTFTGSTFSFAVATLGYSNTGTYFQASRVNAGWFGNENSLSSFSGSPTLADGMPYMWEVVGQRYRFYLDGTLISEVTDDGTNGGVLTSGKPGIGWYWSGSENRTDIAHKSVLIENAS